MAVLIGVATAVVIGALWTLDHLELVPVRRVRTRIGRIAVLPVVASIFLVPSAYQAAMTWFVERKTHDMLEQIQPMLDQLTPPTAPPPATDR